MNAQNRITLKKGQMVSRKNGSYSLHCLSGKIWVTRSGHREDIVLSKGERVAMDILSGSILVEGIENAELEIEKLNSKTKRSESSMKPAAL